MTHDDHSIQVYRVSFQVACECKTLPDIIKAARPAAAFVTGAPVFNRPDSITRLRQGSVARRMGFRPRDIILSVNRETYLQSQDLAEDLQDSGGRDWQITVNRGGEVRRLRFSL